MTMNERMGANGWLIVAPSGRLDAHTAPEAERLLHGKVKGGVRLALDLEGVEYLSSAGLRVLLSTLKLCQAQNGRMVVLGPRENVKEVLEVSGFTALFPVLASEADLE
jgi:anti-sigma B factor antagonist